MHVPAQLTRTLAATAVVAAGAGLLGFSAGSVRGMDTELKALAPAQRVLDGELVLERSRDHDGEACQPEPQPAFGPRRERL